MLNKRTNILFDEEVWKKMVSEARAKNISVGELVRQAIEEKYSESMDLDQRKAVIEDIRKIRPHFKGRLDYKELINYGRKT